MYDPPAGTFSWAEQGWPAQLLSLWKPGVYNVFTRGLVMEFQADHGLSVDGEQTAGLWNDLLAAVASGDDNQGGYDYALGDQHQPESLTIWHDAKVVLHVPANTGIAASPTPDGNFNVYARYRSAIMRGTNPDGAKYADPVQYVAYFYDGDAVHYLARADYGIPQSLGCIELDLADAARAWPFLAYGTIVSVIG
jgi:peptidoglycan hydrolase-like protein with peptidoglycan-binding domain